MPSLHPDLRRLLEKKVIAAREVAESGAATVLKSLAVDQERPFDVLNSTQREHRIKLRAEERRLGGFDTLVSEVAYEAWHTRLFARFLLENNLLIYQDFALTREDLRDEGVQRDFGVHSPEALSVALAANMLPGLFEPQDPSWRLPLPPEHTQKLEHLLNEIPAPVFQAEDSLGWVYQFWQSAESDRVNTAARNAGTTIAAKDMPAVTQYFTEPYMVEWLLDHALDPVLKDQDRDLSQFTILDPSGGSGHFLVAAFGRLVTERARRDGLSDAEAGNRVLSDNVFGLELDPRCVQLAGFNLMFTAWKRGGYRELPLPNVACSGLPAGGEVSEWTRLAEGDQGLQNALWRLHHLFAKGSMLGSLVDPREQAIYLDWSEVEPALEKVLETFGANDDPVAAILGGGARGLLRAVKILSKQYDLVITNVPYLARGKHNSILAKFCAENYPSSKSDLATVFVERCTRFSKLGGNIALVTPHNWLFLGTYKKLRERLLRSVCWKALARLGPGAFETITGEVVKPALLVFTNENPDRASRLCGWDVSKEKTPREKATQLAQQSPIVVDQLDQLGNPDSVISFKKLDNSNLLADYATVVQGVGTTDTPRFVIRFWEVPVFDMVWEPYMMLANGEHFSGYTSLLRWENGLGPLSKISTAHKGAKALGKRGFGVTVTGNPTFCHFLGSRFDCTIAVLLPKSDSVACAIATYLQSSQFSIDIRDVDQALSVTESSFLKVPFELLKWGQLAEEKYPTGLPEPFSDDPTQWLFNGHPKTARRRGGESILQVTVARLLGYLWPEQVSDSLDAQVDADGILPLVPVAGEIAGSERLRQLLEVALDDFSPDVLESLLVDAGFGGKSLEAYLRNGFFVAHCRTFLNRPFLFHIWDGIPDGFAAIVNYHKFDHARLEKLTHTYLGDYIKNQRAGADMQIPGADARLLAAENLQRKLVDIAAGEAPYDIYVRWKNIGEQPIGWQPDLNDGVRLNIRPFVKASVLRSKVNIKWGTDRGKNPNGTERDNDIHLTLAEKHAARARKGHDGGA